MLSDKLILVNYNNMLLLEYCTAEINKYLKKHAATDAKEKVLITVKKILSQLPVIASISYDKRFMPMRDALLKWTDDELAYLSGKAEQSPELIKGPVKQLLKLRLPVPQIALFAALAYKYGIYQDTDKNVIINHILDTYCSKETAQISEGSFRNHFNKPTDTAARGLRKLLRKMLDDLDDFLK